MDKKKYIALMQEYENIVQDKHFNTHFYNKERLNELKSSIIRQLSYHQKRCMVEIESFLLKRRYPLPFDNYELLMEANNMYVSLMEKIEHEESIQGYEYEKCYIELHFRLFIFKQVVILFVIYGLVEITRWCLGYFGSL